MLACHGSLHESLLALIPSNPPQINPIQPPAPFTSFPFQPAHLTLFTLGTFSICHLQYRLPHTVASHHLNLCQKRPSSWTNRHSLVLFPTPKNPSTDYRSSRAISLRPERSLSQGFTSLELDTVLEERCSDVEQTQTEILNPESPMDTTSYKMSFSSS